MHQPPLVSVVLPARNAAGTILRALASVAVQTYPRLEVLVIDDASSDETAALAEGWHGRPIRVERLAEQGGAAAARNRGLELAQGDYIAFLDADDEWLPEKTALQIAALEADPALVFATCEAWMIEPDGRVRGLVNAGRARATGPDGWKTLLRHPCIATPTVMARRTATEAVGGWDTGLTIAEDQDYWIRLALSGPVAHLPYELVRVHDRPDSLSKREYRNTAAITLPMVRKHLEAQRDRLSARERRNILATRYSALGRNAYFGGHIAYGALLLLKAAILGHEPLRNLAYLVLSSPPARRVKHYLRSRPSFAAES